MINMSQRRKINVASRMIYIVNNKSKELEISFKKRKIFGDIITMHRKIKN